MARLDEAGAFFFVVFGLQLIAALLTGRVFGRWSSRSVTREGDPAGFAFHVALLGLGTLLGAVMYLQRFL